MRSQTTQPHLTAEALRAAAGLDAQTFDALAAADLLCPNGAGMYRPKLASWGRKLAYLLDQGWSIEEIKTWAHDRWYTSNPRAWPLMP
jgi:hypothetical protein